MKGVDKKSKDKKDWMEQVEQEVASNSYLACQHEENEMVIKSSRVLEIIAESGLLEQEWGRHEKEIREVVGIVFPLVKKAIDNKLKQVDIDEMVDDINYKYLKGGTKKD